MISGSNTNTLINLKKENNNKDEFYKFRKNVINQNVFLSEKYKIECLPIPDSQR